MHANERNLPQEFFAARYFPSLDGLRAISIVPVVWHHCTPSVYGGVLGRGPVGVDLFFAISGFLITTLLLREIQRTGGVNLRAFYVRRSFRIFPLYYLVLGLHGAFAAWIRPEWSASRTFLEHIVAYATYTANWLEARSYAGPILFAFAWSLCVEEQFYAFWAPVLAWLRNLGVAALLMSTWLCVDILLELGYLDWGDPNRTLLIRVITSFASPIGFGALAAIAIHDARFRSLWRFFGTRIASVILAACVTSLLVRPWAPLPVLHLALAIWVVSCATRRDHALAWLLDHRLMRAIGRVSYGIYLWHVPVIGALRAIDPRVRSHALLVFAVALPLSIAVATVSYLVLEKPLLAIGASLQGRRRRKPYEENTSAESASTVSSSAL